jgi:hypothetical protein
MNEPRLLRLEFPQALAFFSSLASQPERNPPRCPALNLKHASRLDVEYQGNAATRCQLWRFQLPSVMQPSLLRTKALLLARYWPCGASARRAAILRQPSRGFRMASQARLAARPYSTTKRRTGQRPSKDDWARHSTRTHSTSWRLPRRQQWCIIRVSGRALQPWQGLPTS